MIAIRPRSLGLLAATAILFAACAGGASPSASPSSASPSAGSSGPSPSSGSSGPLTATIVTPKGDIVIELKPDTAPIATANFVKLAEEGYYDGVAFHRLVPGFVIQGGDGKYGKVDAFDARKVGTGGPGYTIKDEPVVGEYVRGSVAMARSNLANSQGSQFFIALDDLSAKGQLQTSGGYVIFGQVVEGMDVVDAIAAMPNDGGLGNTALEPVPMESVTISGG